MPKVKFERASTYERLVREVQSWEGGFQVRTPDPQPELFAAELIHRYYNLPRVPDVPTVASEPATTVDDGDLTDVFSAISGDVPG
jgi:hypothetical protein